MAGQRAHQRAGLALRPQAASTCQMVPSAVVAEQARISPAASRSRWPAQRVASSSAPASTGSATKMTSTSVT